MADAPRQLGDAGHGNRGGGPLHNAATSSAAGFMSATDKAALDGLVAGGGGMSRVNVMAIVSMRL